MLQALAGEGGYEHKFRLIGYADSKPRDTADNDAARAKNRRVEIIIQQEHSVDPKENQTEG